VRRLPLGERRISVYYRRRERGRKEGGYAGFFCFVLVFFFCFEEGVEEEVFGLSLGLGLGHGYGCGEFVGKGGGGLWREFNGGGDEVER
jgi:hypothetical protein